MPDEIPQTAIVPEPIARLAPPTPANEARGEQADNRTTGSTAEPADALLPTPGGGRDAKRASITPEQIREFRALVLRKPATNEVAEELSLALGIAQRIRDEGLAIDGAHPRLRFIFDCLLADPPLLILARDERLRLQVLLYQHSGWLSRWLAHISCGSPVALVLTALVASMLIWSVVFLVLRLIGGIEGIAALDVFFMNGKALGIIAFAALIGGIISIATRLNEFSRVRDLDPFAMFWTALLKPLIGVVLAVFILATLAGNVISFGFLGADPLGLGAGKVVDEKVWYILWMLGFLAGFSERFAWDFVDRAEGVAAGGGGSKTT
jgi:hypothetical protein